MPIVCRLVHEVAGRARIRLEALRLFGDLRPGFETFLRGQPGIRGFRLTPACQSLMVDFDPRLLTVEDFLARLGGLSLDDLEASMAGGSGMQGGSSRVCAVIPARNEAPTVGDVVDAARQAALIDEVIVVDNLSCDHTRCGRGGPRRQGRLLQ